MSSQSALRIAAGRLFDGFGWHGPCLLVIEDGVVSSIEPDQSSADLYAKTVLPGLVDFAVSASGYAELPDASAPYAPERSFARMSLRYGVTTYCDTNNSLGPLRYLEGLVVSGNAPRLVHSAGRLTAAPCGRHDIPVRAEDAEATVAALRQAGCGLLSVGLMPDAETFRRVCRAARAQGLAVVVSRQTLPEPPGLIVLRDEQLDAVQDASDAWRADLGGLFVPQIHASARWTVEGLLEAHDAYLASPVLPHCRNFVRSGGRIGKRIARPIVGRYYGDHEPELLDQHLESHAREALEHGRCVASSAGGLTGTVPGLSLWSELERLAALSSFEAALRCVTSVPASALGRSDIGRVRAGAAADLLLCESGESAGLAGLRASLQTIVVGGRVLQAAALAVEVDELVATAVKEY